MDSIFLNLQKTILVFKFTILFLISNLSDINAQTHSPINISWDKEVGCQTYDFELNDNDSIFNENIQLSDCHQLCENESVTYTLSNVPNGAATTWNVTGGIIVSNTVSSCIVIWGNAGTGSISFSTVFGNTVVNETICVEKIHSPKALFDIAPFNQSTPFSVCSFQEIDFTNLSTNNNGSSLVSYLWDFGDGATSTAFQPSHTYTNSGVYTIKLEVRNECNCTDIYLMEVEVGEKGFEISCPTVICEGQTGIYSVPQTVINNCNEFNWSVLGGQIISQNGGQIEVLWNDIGSSGFGYITFDPSSCNLNCAESTTATVPVVQTNGTIQGVSSICLGSQERYKLPQWPTSEIKWEIVGNNNNNLGQILQTDQRNEIIVEPYTTGTFVLRATYINTLLKCSGEAEFTFNVEEPLIVTGDSLLCENETMTYTNSSGNAVNWELISNNGSIVTTQNSSIDFTHTFNQPGTYLLSSNKSGYCNGEQKIIKIVETLNAPVGVNGDLFVCPNFPYSYAVQNPDPLSTYVWEVDPLYGGIQGANEGDEVNVVFNGIFPAEVKVFKQTLSPIECLSDPLVFTVNQVPIDAEISDPQTSICANTEASYSAYDLGTQNLFTDGDDYTWSFENASPNVITASSLGSVTNGQGTNSIEVTWNNVNVVTTVDLVLEVSKCNMTPKPKFVKQITLNPQLEIELVATPNPVCSGDQVVFTVQPLNNMSFSGSEVITWSYGNNSYTGAAGQTSHSFTLISNSLVNVGQIVSATVTNPDCGPPVLATSIVTVKPNPPAIATISSGDFLFCDSASINTTLTVSSNTTGLNNFQWYKGGSVVGAGTSLNVTPSMGPGNYRFQATNINNGCISVSNSVPIFIDSCGGDDCTIIETVTNTSSLTDCGEITLSGTYTGSPNGEVWDVIGASTNNYSMNGNILTGKPGNYTIAYNVSYNCQQGGQDAINHTINVVIPYEPEFSYTVECTANNTFNIDFIDNSIFYAPVTQQNIRFYYKEINAASFTGPVQYSPNLGTGYFEITNLPAGNYVFKQEVDGFHPGTTTYICEKEVVVNLQGVDPGLLITNSSILCHNTAVKFGLNSNPANISVLWDFDDDGAKNMLTPVKRVFNTPNHTYNVSCEVTNELGCSAEFTKSVTIPEECFFGDIASNPSSATVCQNETVDIYYVPNGDNCTNNLTYQWMDGNTPVGGGPHGDTLTVSTSGFYWVKVISQNGCEYSSPTQIKPVFETPPNVKLIGETIVCEGTSFKHSVATNATTIRWYLAGNLHSQFNDMKVANWTFYPIAGTYPLTVEVTSLNGCTNTASMNLTIEKAIQNISFSTSYTCSPYEANITAYPSPFNTNVSYNWSNGASSQDIIVSDGGPYGVTASLGTCKTSKEIDIPRHPDSYLWIYPSGCYEDCLSDKDEQHGQLIGPTLPLPYWSWNEYGNPYQTGNNSYQTPTYLLGDGFYTSTINTGPCQKESEGLDYELKKCEKCVIEVDVVEINQNDTPYCSFTFNMLINSGASSSFQATLTDDFYNVAIIPSTFTVNPGTNNLQFTIIPQSPFIFGTTDWTLQGSTIVNGQYELCIYQFSINIPKCDNAYYSRMIGLEDKTEETNINTLKLSPNPAKEITTVHYEISSSKGELEIYDLSGRSVVYKDLSSSKGKVRVNTNKYQPGIYIVLLRQSNGYTMQQKLIIE